MKPGSCPCALASPAADIWALGLLAFELLINERVFPPDTAPETIRAALLGGAPLPWEAGAEGAKERWQKLRGLRRVVLSCLARDPDARPSTNSLMQSWMHVFDVEQTGGTFAPAAVAPQPRQRGIAEDVTSTGELTQTTVSGLGAPTLQQPEGSLGVRSAAADGDTQRTRERSAGMSPGSWIRRNGAGSGSVRGHRGDTTV